MSAHGANDLQHEGSAAEKQSGFWICLKDAGPRFARRSPDVDTCPSRRHFNAPGHARSGIWVKEIMYDGARGVGSMGMVGCGYRDGKYDYFNPRHLIEFSR